MRAARRWAIEQRFMLRWCVLPLIILVVCPADYAVAHEPVEAASVGDVAADSNEALQTLEGLYKEPTKNLFTLALGIAYWPSLGNKEFGTTSSATNLPGHVSSFGFAFETAYHRHIAHWERVDFYLGAEFGGFALNNVDSDQPPTSPITGDLNALVWYAGPSIKFMMGEGPFKYFLGAGGGYYHLELTEQNQIHSPTCIGPCIDTKRSLQKGTMGGYVSLGVDLVASRTQSGWEWRIRLEDKIHLVNFGSLEDFSPGAGSLSGPINVIQIGVVAGF